MRDNFLFFIVLEEGDFDVDLEELLRILEVVLDTFTDAFFDCCVATDFGALLVVFRSDDMELCCITRA